VVRRQVTIFLPADIAARVDEVRARFDPESARRIRPHVTVVHDGADGPLDDLALADLQSRVARVASEHPAVTLHLGAARHWGSAEGGIYLEVDDRDRALGALRRSLGVGGRSGREFAPHVTLVHVHSVTADAARDAWTALSGWQLDTDVAIESISVIESDDDDMWRTVATFPLLPDAAVVEVDRVAARVLVIDDDGAVLLLQGRDPARPDGGTWWFTPGGGLDEGETSAAGARRELLEETGLAVDDLGEVVFHRVTRFDFEGVHYRQEEDFFCVRVPRFAIDDAGWSDVERRSVLGHRWWAHAELVGTGETIYPETLADLVRDILAR
jgi:8-oxo-dGTP pyrophosphatase MutT (NUDIX family)/2'-5' RNA ligase